VYIGAPQYEKYEKNVAPFKVDVSLAVLASLRYNLFTEIIGKIINLRVMLFKAPTGRE